MRKLSILALLATLWCSLIAGLCPAIAAKFACLSDEKFDCYALAITGEIVGGDYNVFERLLQNQWHMMEECRERRGIGCNWVTTNGRSISATIPYEIVLNSPGGDLGEAMQIGKLVRKLLIDTIAPFVDNELQTSQITFGCQQTKCYCASACFFIWASGIDRHGFELFVHQPYFDPLVFGNLPPEDAIRRHQQMIASARQYLRDMDVTDDVISLMVATPPHTVMKLDWRIADSLRVRPKTLIWNCSVFSAST